MIPLRSHDAKGQSEAADCAARRLFDRLFLRIERRDGSFLLKRKSDGAIVGAGWIERHGREEV